MIQRREQCLSTRIIQTTLNADGTLADGGQRQLRRQRHANTFFQPQAFQARNRKNNGIVVAVIQLAKACADVPAQRANHQIRATFSQLTLAA